MNKEWLLAVNKNRLTLTLRQIFQDAITTY